MVCFDIAACVLVTSGIARKEKCENVSHWIMRNVGSAHGSLAEVPLEGNDNVRYL